MKRHLPLTAVIVGLLVVWIVNNTFDSAELSTLSNDVLATAIRDHDSGVQVTGDGIVTKILADDNDGSRHQRFILRLETGATLLVAHNIDIAPRVTSLQRGDHVTFNGVYEWNAKGGVIHWTHHDPDGHHAAGWLKHNGQTFH